MRKILSAFFIVTVAAVCAFAQSGPMIIITGTSIDDSSSSSSSSNTKNIDQIYNSNTIKNKTDDNINNDNLIIVLYSKGQKIMFLLL